MNITVFLVNNFCNIFIRKEFYMNKKFVNLNLNKRIFIVFIFMMFLIFVFVSASSYASMVSDDLSNNLLRLHIIANSDSDEDQNLKLKVRDRLIKYLNSIVSSSNTKDEVVEILKDHIHDMENISLAVIHENGFDYNVTVSLDHIDFPTKSYGNVSLPSGFYDTVDVHIGSSSGHNWWCVMFPPLCLVNDGSFEMSEDSQSNLKENLNSEEYNLITDSNQVYEFKFKIVEIINNLKNNQ